MKIAYYSVLVTLSLFTLASCSNNSLDYDDFVDESEPFEVWNIGQSTWIQPGTPKWDKFSNFLKGSLHEFKPTGVITGGFVIVRQKLFSLELDAGGDFVLLTVEIGNGWVEEYEKDIVIGELDYLIQ